MDVMLYYTKLLVSSVYTHAVNDRVLVHLITREKCS